MVRLILQTAGPAQLEKCSLLHLSFSLSASFHNVVYLLTTVDVHNPNEASDALLRHLALSTDTLERRAATSIAWNDFRAGWRNAKGFLVLPSMSKSTTVIIW